MRLSIPTHIRSWLVGAGVACVLAGEASAHVHLNQPNGGEVFGVGTTVQIEWVVVIQHGTQNWDLTYSTTGASGPWMPIATDLPVGDPTEGVPHTYQWPVPDDVSNTVRVRVCQDNSPGGNYYDVSDGDLEIAMGENYCSATSNSTGAPASITATGSNAVADNDLTLTAFGMPTGQFGYFLCSRTQGFVQGLPGSSGNLCLAGDIGRFNGQVQNTGSAGSFSIPVDLTSLPVNPPAPALPGETWNFQSWFRDVVGGNFTSNTSDGVAITWQ